MILLMNIIVMLLESLYYSLFMKFIHKQGSILKYLITFVLISCVGLIIGTSNLPSYLLLVLMILFGLKYIIKIKINLYDMLVILIMLFLKLIIETPLYVLLINFMSNFALIILSSAIKIVILFLLKNKLKYYYDKLKIKWNNNDFYIRYIFSIFVFIYTIASCIFIIVKLF